jgi:hypothetical protein
MPVLGKDVITALREAGIIQQDRVTRVVIDLRHGEAAKIHVECWGDERLLNIRQTLEGIQVSREEPAEVYRHPRHAEVQEPLPQIDGDAALDSLPEALLYTAASWRARLDAERNGIRLRYRREAQEIRLSAAAWERIKRLPGFDHEPYALPDSPGSPGDGWRRPERIRGMQVVWTE